MKREDELKQVIKKAHEELSEIEGVQHKKENKDYVGKFFVFDNGYGPDECWPLYQAVTGVGKSGMLTGWRFETTSLDECQIRFQEEWCHADSLGERTTKAKFFAAYRKLLKRLAKLEA